MDETYLENRRVLFELTPDDVLAERATNLAGRIRLSRSEALTLLDLLRLEDARWQSTR